jgi:hypothetical protein
MNLGRSSLLFLKTENFRVPSSRNGSGLRARARLRIENRPVKNQILGSQDNVSKFGSSRCCRVEVSLLRGGKVPWINGEHFP